jgi:dTDP-glucose 4,6-dehydratase
VGEIYHLSPDSGIAVRTVVESIARRLSRRFEDVVEVVDERPGQDAAYVIDSSRARSELGWKPAIDFAHGIDEVVEWVEEYWNEIERSPLEYQHKE